MVLPRALVIVSMYQQANLRLAIKPCHLVPVNRGINRMYLTVPRVVHIQVLVRSFHNLESTRGHVPEEYNVILALVQWRYRLW